MSTANLYKLHAINCAGGQIEQLTQRTINPGVQEQLIKGDGRISPHFLSIMKQRPMLSFTTTAVGAFLTAVGSAFYNATAAVDAYISKLVQGGGLAGSTSHIKMSIAQGIIIPRRLECSHGQPATISADVWARSTDGTTSPLSYTAAQSLLTLATHQAYTLGPIKLNAGSALVSIEKLSVDFGYQEIVFDSDGNVYPTFTAYQGRAPKITFTSKDATLYTSIGVQGLALTAGTFYLAAMASAGGTRVANGTASHIKLTTTTGYAKITSSSDSDDSESSFEVEVTPYDDGTNDIMAPSIAAIT